MAFNPSKQQEPLSAASSSRKNSTNDPGFENKQGYYPYDLSHTEVLANLFGQVTPSMHLITNMGDRHVVRDDCKLLLNRINGNFLNTVNQYTDSFFVSNRTLFPTNWDKLIPNPVKGDDLPNSARPVVPLFDYFRRFLFDENNVRLVSFEGQPFDYKNTQIVDTINDFVAHFNDDDTYVVGAVEAAEFAYAINQLTMLATMVSRGQLLDYLGVQFDLKRTDDYLSSFQYSIDNLFQKYYAFVNYTMVPLARLELDPGSDYYDFSDIDYTDGIQIDSLSQFRERLMTGFERGEFVVPYLYDWSLIPIVINDEGDESYEPGLKVLNDLATAVYLFYIRFSNIFTENSQTIAVADASDSFNERGQYVNISKALAYQLCIAQYYTNDSVDNIFTSDLYMQLLRGSMFPSVNNRSTEPTFYYNGVPFEYDYISYGGFYDSLIRHSAGVNSRRFIVGSLLFILRRSLRYGDYFTTGRTRMLAVGQLSVPVDDEGGMSVNPVDITIGLVSQRYLNAANRVGNKPLAYYASMMGVTPSDMPSIPRYVAHRKVELENRVTTNTSEEQGKQTTNLVGYSDNSGFDVFIDDYGILLSLVSYDILPIYNSGIDSDNYLSDRFEFFNPMMQNIGDQPIRLSELIGNPTLYKSTFAYVVRNAEYKFKNSKSHGALCYNMPGFLLKFPLQQYNIELDREDYIRHIDPDFIRDKPSLIDSIITHNTGASPGDYYHFINSVHNEVKSARLIQKSPGILF